MMTPNIDDLLERARNLWEIPGLNSPAMMNMFKALYVAGVSDAAKLMQEECDSGKIEDAKTCAALLIIETTLKIDQLKDQFLAMKAAVKEKKE